MTRAKEMQDLIRRWEGSGLAQRAFAEREGVSYSAFQYWRRRVLRSGSSARRPAAAASLELAPVRVVPDRAPRAAGFELRTPSGHAVSVPAGVDGAELARLLDVLC